MDVRGCRSIDQQTQQLRPAVVATRIHQLFALVDASEVEVGDDRGLSGSDWFTEQGAIRCNDRRKATTGDRANAATGVLDDLRLLIGIQPRGRADHEARRLQRMLPDIDLCLFGERAPKIDPGYIAAWICSPSAIIA